MKDFTHPLLPNGIPDNWVTGSGKQRVLNLPFVAGESLLKAIQEDSELGEFDWQLNCQIKKLKNSQPELPLTTGNVIVVSSGKGGVGKSSVSVNLALALSQLGAKVGLLDADIYGPSIPTMLGGGGSEMELTKNNKMMPLERHGLHVHSLGYLVEDNDATIWRGPMASGALQQLYKDTAWPALDYLIVDMPPGTGDIQLTAGQPGWVSKPLISGEAEQFETDCVSPWADIIDCLASKKVKASRRAMRLKPTDPELCWDGSDAVIYFELPKGSFATACISELIDLSVTENDEDSVE